jgi:mannosyltransferase
MAIVLLCVEAIFALWLRFKTNSLLWLDEAQTVNIAKAPLSQIPHLLRLDGAPPLYYLLLHLWMQLFGTSDVAVRSLSGILSIAAVVVTYYVVRPIWGKEAGLIAAALLGASPFATYYATETRMYALVMLLVALGIGALRWLYETPSIARLFVLALVFAALLYTQYWSFYLLAILGLWFVVAWWRGGSTGDRRPASYVLGAMVAAGVAFLPWLPTFRFQSAHTGTPWGSPPNFFTAIVAVFHFHANQALQVPLSDLRQRGMEVVFIVLFVVALFGRPTPERQWRFSWRPQTKGRMLAWVVFGTLVLGVLVSHFTNNAYAPRYGSVVYVPLMAFMAVGILFFRPAWFRLLLTALLVVGFLVGGFIESTTQRSQAGQVAAVLRANASPGDVALYCPDELGPTVLRVLPAGTVHNIGFPRFSSPEIVDWIDYAKLLNSTSISGFIDRTDALAGANHVWLVWSPGYGASGPVCTQLVQALKAQPQWTSKVWVDPKPATYFQSMQVIEFSKSP